MSRPPSQKINRKTYWVSFWVALGSLAALATLAWGVFTYFEGKKRSSTENVLTIEAWPVFSRPLNLPQNLASRTEVKIDGVIEEDIQIKTYRISFKGPSALRTSAFDGPVRLFLPRTRKVLAVEANSGQFAVQVSRIHPHIVQIDPFLLNSEQSAQVTVYSSACNPDDAHSAEALATEYAAFSKPFMEEWRVPVADCHIIISSFPTSDEEQVGRPWVTIVHANLAVVVLILSILAFSLVLLAAHERVKRGKKPARGLVFFWMISLTAALATGEMTTDWIANGNSFLTQLRSLEGWAFLAVLFVLTYFAIAAVLGFLLVQDRVRRWLLRDTSAPGSEAVEASEPPSDTTG